MNKKSQKSEVRSQSYNIKTKNFYFWFLVLFLSITACAAPTIKKTVIPSDVPGTYHKVSRGQTLWRISKVYNVDLDELVRINRISDATSIEVGQLIFVPYATKQIEDLTMQPATGEDFVWPVKGKVISSFGQAFNNRINKGIYIKPFSPTDILSSRSGRVVFYSDNFKGYEKTMIVDHGDSFLTVYTGDFQPLINLGGTVYQKKAIARLNSSSKNAYLHFEIRKKHIAQNPYFYLAQ